MANLRQGRTLYPEDLIFLVRYDRAKVNRLRTYLSWKDIRKNAKEDSGGSGAPGEMDMALMGDDEGGNANANGPGGAGGPNGAAGGGGGGGGASTNTRKLKVKLPWELNTIFADYVVPGAGSSSRNDTSAHTNQEGIAADGSDAPANSATDLGITADEELDEDDQEALLESRARLREADRATLKMTREQYEHYSECRAASFTFKKGKKFREFISSSTYLDNKPNDDIVDILGFLAFEVVRELTLGAREAWMKEAYYLLDKEKEREDKANSIKKTGKVDASGGETSDQTEVSADSVASGKAEQNGGQSQQGAGEASSESDKATKPPTASPPPSSAAPATSKKRKRSTPTPDEERARSSPSSSSRSQSPSKVPTQPTATATTESDASYLSPHTIYTSATHISQDDYLAEPEMFCGLFSMSEEQRLAGEKREEEQKAREEERRRIREEKRRKSEERRIAEEEEKRRKSEERRLEEEKRAKEEEKEKEAQEKEKAKEGEEQEKDKEDRETQKDEHRPGDQAVPIEVDASDAHTQEGTTAKDDENGTESNTATAESGKEAEGESAETSVAKETEAQVETTSSQQPNGEKNGAEAEEKEKEPDSSSGYEDVAPALLPRHVREAFGRLQREKTKPALSSGSRDVGSIAGGLRRTKTWVI